MISTTASDCISDLPDEFGTWPEGARRAYLEATLDRDSLLELVAARSGLAGAGGELTKYQLATVAVKLGGQASE